VDSPFDVLQLDADADDEAVKQAYRRRVKEAHPDHGGSKAEFQRVRAAYEAIKAGETLPESWPEPEVEEPAEPEDQDPLVEYLDYEVLADNGWELTDEDLFEKAAAANLAGEDYGEFRVEERDTLLEAAEEHGFTWPFSCRGGACANCAVAVVEGDLSLPVSHVLPSEMTDRGIRLSCVGEPITDDLKVVYNVKHLPDLDELRLPPGPYEWASDD
jgi:ferredoxin